MDAVVVVILVSVYVAAILGPLAVLNVARRTNQSAIFQATIVACIVLIWGVLALAGMQEFLHLTLFDTLLERFGLLAVLACSILAVQGFLISVRAWPERPDEEHAATPFPGQVRRSLGS